MTDVGLRRVTSAHFLRLCTLFFLVKKDNICIRYRLKITLRKNHCKTYGLQAYNRNTEATESSYFLRSKSRKWRKSILSETFAITKRPRRRTARIIYTFFPHYLDQRFLWRVLKLSRSTPRRNYHATVSNKRGKFLLKRFNRNMFMKKMLALAIYNKSLQIQLTCQTTFAGVIWASCDRGVHLIKPALFVLFLSSRVHLFYWKATEFGIRQRALRNFSHQLI